MDALKFVARLILYGVILSVLIGIAVYAPLYLTS